MPYPNEHAARIQDPDRYVRFRRKAGEFGKGIDVIYGVTGDGSTEVQAIRFNAEQFTPSQARAWLQEHDYTDLILFEEASGEAAAIALNLEGPTVDLVSQTESPDGIKRARLKKEIARVGSYVHPDTGRAFEITDGMCRNFVAQFHLMQINGVAVPFQRGHNIEDDTARNTLGTVYDMAYENGSLFGFVEVIGAEAIEEALRNDVSIFSPPEWMDGKGNVYRGAVVHVALHPYPVLPGLGGWQMIAACHRGGRAAARKAGVSASRINGGDAVDLEKMKALAAVLGIENTDAMTEENALEMISEAAKALKAQIDDLSAKSDQAAQALEAAKTEAARLAEGVKEPELPEAMLELGRDHRNTKIDALVEAGKLKPSCADAVRKRFAQGDGLKLSLGKGREDFNFWLGILGENEIVDLKDKSGAQILRLAQHGAETLDDNPLVRSAKKMADARSK